MSATFPLVEPVFVQALTAEEQHLLQQHGCSVKVYPNERIRLGYMITFPKGVEMDMVNFTYAKLLFPDGYNPLLIWTGKAYCFNSDREMKFFL